MACKSPDRISAIVGVGPVMPANQPKHFQRMPKWTRFIIANARYAPRALPYVTMALFQSIRRLGPKRFIQTVLATSKADLKVLEDNEILTSMLRGTEIAVGPRFTAHVAWAAGAVSNYAVDWSAKLKACSVPMILYAGHQDPFAPFETTKEFAATNDRIVLRGYADYGQLLYPLWPRFLEDVRQHLSN
jgi:pimeloyl-ACP methyl ester carboxylesterase